MTLAPIQTSIALMYDASTEELECPKLISARIHNIVIVRTINGDLSYVIGKYDSLGM